MAHHPCRRTAWLSFAIHLCDFAMTGLLPPDLSHPHPQSRLGVSARREPVQTRPGFRPDIEGLRALAVLAVMLWHAKIPGFSGGFVGVDAFFVISGYLMTLQLTRELENTGHISLRRFYARRAKRLLPAAFAAIAVTVVAARAIYDATRWATVAWDGIWATVYGANWRFIKQSTDYMASEQPPSPFQHFWSLSVEEQFYVVFPIMLVASYLAARRLTATRRTTNYVARLAAVITVTTIVGASLVWCLMRTPAHPASSYFSTFTRGWELALGGVVALGRPGGVAEGRRRPRLQFAALIALCVLLGTMVLLPDTQPFPGWRALLATVPTAIIIAVGSHSTQGMASALLSARPMIWIGSLSYSLYLWHWPVFILGGELLHPNSPRRIWHVLVLFAVTFAIAWLSHTLVENPVRRRQITPRRVFAAAATSTLVVLALAGAVVAETAMRDNRAQKRLQTALGARIVPDPVPAGYNPAITDLEPQSVQDPATLHRSSLPQYWRTKCFADATDLEKCSFGTTSARVRVLVIGDSTAGMWQSAIERAADTLHFRGALIIRHYCAFADATVIHDDKPNQDCRIWGRQVLAAVLRTPPDAVIVPTPALYRAARADGTALTGSASSAAIAAGLARTWNALADRGIDVYVIPPLGSLKSGLDCALKHNGDGTDCGVPRRGFFGPSRAILDAAVRQAPRVHVINILPVICPGTTCSPVIGQLFVLHDSWHLSDQFARSLGGHLISRLQSAGWAATASGR